MSKISVIIPVYNVEQYLSKCLDSIINQTFKDIEIICVNDGSTDSSLQILKKYASKDERITIINQENKGVSSARNKGLEYANSEYVMFFDGDDYFYSSSAFDIAYNTVIENNSDIGIFGYYNLSDAGLYVDCFYSKFKEATPCVGANNYFDYPIFVHDKIFRTEFLKKYNIRFNENVKNAEDFLFSLMCYFNNPKYSLINKCLYVYRENRADSATNNHINCIKNDAQAFFALYDLAEFKKQPLDFQLKIANRFLNAALWYIKKFDENLQLVNDSKILIKFLKTHYAPDKLKRLKAYRQLSNYERILLLHSIFSIRNSFNKSDKICTVLGLKFRFKRRSKKHNPDILNSQKIVKEIFLELNNEKQFPNITPLSENQNSNVIVFSFDNNYAKYFSVALKSLISHTADNKFYDIIIFSDDLSERNEKLLRGMLPENFRMRIYNISQIFKNTKLTKQTKVGSYWHINSYYRLFIPILMQQFERVLYCDSDIVFTSAIDELFEVSFENKLLMAALDSITPTIIVECSEKKRLEQLKKVLKLKNPELYINSGVCIFNTKKIDLDKYITKIIYALNIPGLLYPDQDILNIVFENNIKYLPWKYNFEWHIPNLSKRDADLFFGSFRHEYFAAYNSPSIIHFTSNIKPWTSPQGIFAEKFWETARQTPFYEEILFENCCKIKESTIKNLNQKRKIYFNYYKYKLMTALTKNSKKERYEIKKMELKEQIRNIRHYSKL